MTATMTPKAIKIFFVLSLLFVIFFSFGTDLAKIKKGGFFADESTYFSIIQSLAFDGDLEYTRADIIRIREVFSVGPMGLFLKKSKDGRLFYRQVLSSTPCWRHPSSGWRGITASCWPTA